MKVAWILHTVVVLEQLACLTGDLLVEEKPSSPVTVGGSKELVGCMPHV